MNAEIAKNSGFMMDLFDTIVLIIAVKKNLVALLNFKLKKKNQLFVYGFKQRFFYKPLNPKQLFESKRGITQREILLRIAIVLMVKQ
jgi:hypothetical protein